MTEGAHNLPFQPSWSQNDGYAGAGLNVTASNRNIPSQARPSGWYVRTESTIVGYWLLARDDGNMTLVPMNNLTVPPLQGASSSSSSSAALAGAYRGGSYNGASAGVGNSSSIITEYLFSGYFERQGINWWVTSFGNQEIATFPPSWSGPDPAIGARSCIVLNTNGLLSTASCDAQLEPCCQAPAIPGPVRNATNRSPLIQALVP